MQQELVSIITPMYNASRFVAQTIESVLAQTYPLWEMLIVNDGSKDNSAEIVAGYVEKDCRITLIQQSNGGSANARNTGLRNAKGKYICFLDADDLWNSNFLEAQINFMGKTNSLVVTASYNMINEEGIPYLNTYIVPEHIERNGLLKFNSLSCLTTIYNAEKLNGFYFREDLKSFRDDLFFWLEILNHVKIACGNHEVLASYRVFTNSTTGNKKKIIIPHFLFLYRILKLGLIKSMYYTVYWAIHGILKYRKKYYS